MFEVLKSNSRLETKILKNSLAESPFGTLFTDHMFLMHYDEDNLWHEGKIMPFGSLSLHPASSVFHYGQAIFEGLKIYCGDDGNIRFFRIGENSKRFNRSAQRMLMPKVSAEIFKNAITELVKVDKNFVPEIKDGSLYIRPFMFAAQPTLGVNPSSKFVFCIIASPVGSYFKNSPKAIDIWIEQEYVRAFPGGVGAAKFSGNYAASFAAQQKALEQNCDQVIFLDALNRENFEELGAMNIFFIKDNYIITSAVSDTILKGVTRDSVLCIAKEFNLNICERAYSLNELKRDIETNSLKESFACGTAASIVSIKKFKYANGELYINCKEEYKFADKIRTKLTNIQSGAEDDIYGWTEIIINQDDFY